MRLGGQATQRTWKIMWNQINCFRRAVNATGEGEGEEGARSIAQSYECVCVPQIDLTEGGSVMT